MDTGDGLEPASAARRTRLLWLVAAAEALTLAVLLVNLVTLHVEPVAQAVGPLHGLLYVSGVALAWHSPLSLRLKAAAVVPVVGAVLAAVAQD
ncbi:hypothetical protein CLV35_2995 [Motilibacter peucedani]|uniref:Integral membrane protein n=1 Tax=Motilibacter peucedani TaxID=598650 RepID=A0A420XN90_9ACTN|nr:hypothetical protein [Motilibacter peucedani]RKS72746.1 hypothetical protein CLV35_2995 [Motilibacter peucedani]